MAPQKRKSSEEDTDTSAVSTTRRVTRGQTRQLQNSVGGDSVTPAKETKTKKPKKEVSFEKDVTTETTTAKNATNDEHVNDAPTLVIEHCKQCNRFKTRALQVQKALEQNVPGITVMINPEKPRRGCFEIRLEGGQTFISLLNLKRPFKPLTDLDMDEVIGDIIVKIKT